MNTFFRALLLIGGALTLMGASPHPSPKERELQSSSQTKYEDYDYSKYFREACKAPP